MRAGTKERRHEEMDGGHTEHKRQGGRKREKVWPRKIVYKTHDADTTKRIRSAAMEQKE